MTDENMSPQEKARAAMLARSNKGKKVVVKSEAVKAAEAEALLKRGGKKGGKSSVSSLSNTNQAPTKGGKIIENF
jgi:hypothetical protein